MVIFYFMIEAAPNRNNPESKKFGGAYINCWVKAETQKDAFIRVKKYIDEENWMFIKTEDIFIAQRHLYIDKPDSLDCYDEACKNGISAIFHTWPIDEDYISEYQENQFVEQI